MTLTLDDWSAARADHAVTLECAGNGRMVMRPLPTGEPWGDYAVWTARWKGALLPTCSRRRGRPRGRRGPFRGRRSRPVQPRAVLADTDKQELPFVRSLALAPPMDPAPAMLVA